MNQEPFAGSVPTEYDLGSLVECPCERGHLVFIDDGDGGVYACPVCALAEVKRRIEAWIRHGEAVPVGVTTYERWIVHNELRELLARPTSPAAAEPISLGDFCHADEWNTPPGDPS